MSFGNFNLSLVIFLLLLVQKCLNITVVFSNIISKDFFLGEHDKFQMTSHCKSTYKKPKKVKNLFTGGFIMYGWFYYVNVKCSSSRQRLHFP